jgi:hypothetical protein
MYMCITRNPTIDKSRPNGSALEIAKVDNIQKNIKLMYIINVDHKELLEDRCQLRDLRFPLLTPALLGITVVFTG